MNQYEFYTVGHDIPESLTERGLVLRGKTSHAFFFGGIGDARHLFATMTAILETEKKQQRSGEQTQNRYHFTIVDLKAPAIARNLVVLMLIGDLAATYGSKSEQDWQQTVVLFTLTLYYTYVAHMMPTFAYDILQSRIQRLINGLEGSASLPSYLDVPQMYRQVIVQVLQSWQKDTPAAFPVRSVREQHLREYKGKDAVGPFGMPSQQPISQEEKFFRRTGILLPKMPLAKLQTAVEQEAFEKFASGGATIDEAFFTHMDETWKTNVTMIDLEWERSKGNLLELDMSNNPFRTFDNFKDSGLTPKRLSGLCSILEWWFLGVTESLQHLKGRMTVEAIPGGVTIVLEQIRFGIVGHRTMIGTAANPASEQASTPEISKIQYPHVYDRIHLSNIPDYIGGTLPMCLYALPITTLDTTSFVTSVCLRNPPRFKTHDDYNNEYLGGISDHSDLESTFQMRMGHRDTGPLFPLADYTDWHHTRAASSSSANLMPWARFDTWFYRLFLKIAIPMPRKVNDIALVYSPLNLTAFFRVCEHLHVAGGYPAHWLSQVLASIMLGSITTTARAPRSDPLSIQEVNTKMPCRGQSTAPFVAEMTTLGGIWNPFLPFGIISRAIVPADMICKYRVKFDEIPKPPSRETIVNANILVFFDTKLFMSASRKLRQFLVDDETSNQSAAAKEARTNGIQILTTWEFEYDRRAGTFWLRCDAMEDMEKADWGVQIWRTDTWSPRSGPERLQEKLEHLGQTWVDDL